MVSLFPLLFSVCFSSFIVDSSTNTASEFILSDFFTGYASKEPKSIISLRASESGEIKWFRSFHSSSSFNESSTPTFNATWESFQIATIPGAQHADSYDINGDGFPDLVISYKYGKCPVTCIKQENGYLAWLENPQGQYRVSWIFHEMAKPQYAAHRVVIVNRKSMDPSQVRILSIPISGWSRDGNDPFMTFFTISSFSLPPLTTDLDGFNWTAQEQSISFIDERTPTVLNLCHEGKEFYVNGKVGLGLSCLQGGIFLELNPSSPLDIWKRKQLINPIPFNAFRQSIDHPYHYNGISSMSQCNQNNGIPFYAFIAPFHDGRIGISDFQGSTAFLIDDVAGVGHDIYCGNFSSSSSGVDDILVAFRKNKTGLLMYSYQEKRKVWSRREITNKSVNFFSVGDFNGDGFDDVSVVHFGASQSIHADSNIVIHSSPF